MLLSSYVVVTVQLKPIAMKALQSLVLSYMFGGASFSNLDLQAYKVLKLVVEQYEAEHTELG